MTRDYASRARTKSTRKPQRSSARVRTPKVKKSTPARSAASISFSAPSFSAGLILGAGLVLLLPYLMSLLEETPGSVAAVPAQQEPEIVFDFEDRLQRSEVAVDTSAYPVEFESEDPSAATSTYLLQAASFHSFAEAANLQAQLSRQQLPAMVSRVTVGEKPWYRVTVGPFHRKKDAERAMTQLRENNLSPLPLTQG